MEVEKRKTTENISTCVTGTKLDLSRNVDIYPKDRPSLVVTSLVARGEGTS